MAMSALETKKKITETEDGKLFLDSSSHALSARRVSLCLE
jgi:hypothetical protein